MPSAHYRLNKDGSVDMLIDPSSIVWGPPRSVPFKEYPVKQEVVEFICDNCGAEKGPEEDTSVENPIPELWITVQMTWNHGTLESVDLCNLCRTAFNEALLARRT